MGMIQFVANYDDLSSDKGYQFKFYCDKCRNGYVSRFVPSKIGMASSILRTAGSMFGGWMSSAGHNSYDLQRMIGGPEHDSAMRDAMEEGKKYFHQCTRCAKWVCPQACWNEKANLCEDCAPNFQEEVASAQASAKIEAMRQQVQAKAQQVNYAEDILLGKDVHYRAPDPGERPPSTPVCPSCKCDVSADDKFCPHCGKPTAAAPKKFCGQCGNAANPNVKFCPNCGNKMG